MLLEELIVELSHELDLEATLEPEMPGVYSLPLDDNLSVTVSKTSEGILLYCAIAPTPQLKKEQFYEELLLANLFGQGTALAVLGLTEDGKEITLTQYIDREPDYAAFSEMLEDFINTIDFWRTETLATQRP